MSSEVRVPASLVDSSPLWLQYLAQLLCTQYYRIVLIELEALKGLWALTGQEGHRGRLLGLGSQESML